MADSTTNVDAHHDEVHPTEKQYWLVFVALAVLTALEVSLSYMDLDGPSLVVPLIILMGIKFLLVAGAFMHLYFDLKILNGRLFSWAFAGAIALALSVYAAVIAAFQFNV